jgi:hypothetical protein
VDATGKVVATARSDFDGFFLFERVPYGEYRVRLAEDSARAARVIADLGIRAAVSAERSVARLGTISAIPLPTVASTGLPPKSSLE